MNEVKKAFNPEFLNRLDEVILFTSLADEDLNRLQDALARLRNRSCDQAQGCFHRQTEVGQRLRAARRARGATA